MAGLGNSFFKGSPDKQAAKTDSAGMPPKNVSEDPHSSPNDPAGFPLRHQSAVMPNPFAGAPGHLKQLLLPAQSCPSEPVQPVFLPVVVPVAQAGFRPLQASHDALLRHGAEVVNK